MINGYLVCQQIFDLTLLLWFVIRSKIDFNEGDELSCCWWLSAVDFWIFKVNCFLKPVTVHFWLLCKDVFFFPLPPLGKMSDVRAVRKRQQLNNLVVMVTELARPGYTVVDFCSGTVRRLITQCVYAHCWTNLQASVHRQSLTADNKCCSFTGSRRNRPGSHSPRLPGRVCIYADHGPKGSSTYLIYINIHRNRQYVFWITCVVLIIAVFCMFFIPLLVNPTSTFWNITMLPPEINVDISHSTGHFSGLWCRSSSSRTRKSRCSGLRAGAPSWAWRTLVSSRPTWTTILGLFTSGWVEQRQPLCSFSLSLIIISISVSQVDIINTSIVRKWKWPFFMVEKVDESSKLHTSWRYFLQRHVSEMITVIREAAVTVVLY